MWIIFLIKLLVIWAINVMFLMFCPHKTFSFYCHKGIKKTSQSFLTFCFLTWINYQNSWQLIKKLITYLSLINSFIRSSTIHVNMLERSWRLTVHLQTKKPIPHNQYLFSYNLINILSSVRMLLSINHNDLFLFHPTHSWIKS